MSDQLAVAVREHLRLFPWMVGSGELREALRAHEGRPAVGSRLLTLEEFVKLNRARLERELREFDEKWEGRTTNH